METFVSDWWWSSHQSLAREGVRIFRFCVMALERWARTHYRILSGEDKLTWFKSSWQYRTLETIDGEPMEFEWNIFLGFTTLQLCYKVQEFMSKMCIQPEDITGRIIFMSMFNESHGDLKKISKNANRSAQLVSVYAKRFSPGRWSFLGPGSEKKWYSTLEM